MEKIILTLMLIAVSVICTVLIIDRVRNKKKILMLTDSINNFLEKGILTEISVKDGAAAGLQTAIRSLQERIIQEKENSEREQKSNTEFISDISHQLKTPLAGLRLFCEMDAYNEAVPHTKQKLQLIDKTENLIISILKLEKIRSDAYTMNFKKEKISEITGELKAEFLTLFPEKVIIEECTGELRCDRMWLKEAIGNVIKNACEHTKPDGRIHIKTVSGEKSLCLITEDDGGGVSAGDLPLLFKRFHRTENSSPDSAGIGLAVTKAVTEKHHGTITAENTDKGLRITMCFPLLDMNIKL